MIDQQFIRFWKGPMSPVGISFIGMGGKRAHKEVRVRIIIDITPCHRMSMHPFQQFIQPHANGNIPEGDWPGFLCLGKTPGNDDHLQQRGHF